MSDKYEKLSIYNVDFKMEDSDGVEQVFVFKPLPFGSYPDVYDVMGTLADMEGDGADAFKSIDRATMKKLMDLELQMVINSDVGMDLAKAQNFVASNVFTLIEPLMGITFKQEKGNTRKMEKAKKE